MAIPITPVYIARGASKSRGNTTSSFTLAGCQGLQDRQGQEYIAGVCVVGVWGMYVQEGMVGLRLISLFLSLCS